MGSLAGDKDHRVFIDSASGVGGATAVLYANNILSAHREDYAGADGEYAMIVCFRHAATALGYTDAMWQKYGEVLPVTRLSVPDGDSPLAVNPLNLEGANFGNIGNAAVMFAGAAFTLPSAIVRRTPCPAGSLRLPGSLQPATTRS